MLYIVHGEDIVKSRTLIVNQQKKLNVQHKKEFALEEIELSELAVLLGSTSLFGEAIFLTIDITKAKGTQEHLKYLSNKPDNTTVVLYAEKTLPKSNIFIKEAEKLNSKIIENKIIPTENIFKFVDVLFSKDRNTTYKEYEKLIIADTDPFYIMSMIYYGLRNIAKCVYESPTFKNATPFIKNKNINLAKKYTKEQIQSIYEKYYELEKDMKLGLKEENLVVTMAIENVLNSK